ncbi:5'/3'-nucleotidase SurE [Paracoccidioides brasiliensis Pb03]|nr:5'/3'-nucleotidase SurE [Paracoccidioides brasiliensis Pb03]
MSSSSIRLAGSHPEKLDGPMISFRCSTNVRTLLADKRSFQIVNDDGPPSQKCSPYIFPLVKAFQDAGHLVSVAIPNSSRSWIGKAHLIGELLKATYVLPEALLGDAGSSVVPGNHDSNELGRRRLQESGAGSWQHHEISTPDSVRKSNTDRRHWVVVNGTPAACAQLGIYSLFPDRGPVDLVVSGPNHGRNASTIYGLASGTVGGALEAATCGKKAIALSFASKDAQPPEVIQAAARLSVRLIEHLSARWPLEGVHLYNINVPMRLDVEERPIAYTSMLQNSWSKFSLYKEADDSTVQPNDDHGNKKERQTRYFIWAPELSDIKQSVEMSHVGTDTYTVTNGCTSVTPLTANFGHAPGFHGELQL